MLLSHLCSRQVGCSLTPWSSFPVYAFLRIPPQSRHRPGPTAAFASLGWPESDRSQAPPEPWVKLVSAHESVVALNILSTSVVMNWKLPSIPYPTPQAGYWSPVTSTLNWCEEVR